MKIRLLMLLLMFCGGHSHANCLEQLHDFLNQYNIRPFQVMEEGMEVPNRYTHTFSVIEDLVIEIKDKDQIPLIAKSAFPNGQKRRTSLAQKLQEQFDSGKKRVSLRLVAPQVVADLTNRTPRCDGPNCFNATLKWFYPAKELEETHPIEMDNYLKTHFKEIFSGEDLQFGDVLVWKNSRGELIHSAIFINETYSWHKATFSETSSWVFEKTSAINMMYGIDSSSEASLAAYRHAPRW